MPPPRSVLDAFGIDGTPVALAGGEGVTFRVADVVLKWVHDGREAGWTQELLSRTEPAGFRLPAPVPTTDGRWVHDRWTASRYLSGLRPAAPAWDTIAEAGLRFAGAAERARGGGGADLLAERTHRWAVADRVAWGETEVELDPPASDVLRRLSGWLGVPSGEKHLIHGDLSGNVAIDPSGVPVILDVSPYLRPRRWATAIVVADAVLWNGAPSTLAASFASDAQDRDLLGRALVFRLVAEQLADDPRHGALLDPYRRLLAALG